LASWGFGFHSAHQISSDTIESCRGVVLTGSDAAHIQEAHYDRIAGVYLENLQYPHTTTYLEYFDRALVDLVEGQPTTVLEICCGAGEGCSLLQGRYARAIGIDISRTMLRHARRRFAENRCTFVQADATCLPCATASIDAVVMV